MTLTPVHCTLYCISPEAEMDTFNTIDLSGLSSLPTCCACAARLAMVIIDAIVADMNFLIHYSCFIEEFLWEVKLTAGYSNERIQMLQIGY